LLLLISSVVRRITALLCFKYRQLPQTATLFWMMLLQTAGSALERSEASEINVGTGLNKALEAIEDCPAKRFKRH
jgi:hypothetical protein